MKCKITFGDRDFALKDGRYKGTIKGDWMTLGGAQRSPKWDCEGHEADLYNPQHEPGSPTMWEDTVPVGCLGLCRVWGML